MEGEAIASRILELGPSGAKFLGWDYFLFKSDYDIFMDLNGSNLYYESLK